MNGFFYKYRIVVFVMIISVNFHGLEFFQARDFWLDFFQYNFLKVGNSIT